MENKPTNEKGSVDDSANQDGVDQSQDANQDANQETEQKIGFKNQKPGKAKAGETDEKWKKVDSIVNAAKDAYDSGKSGFRDVVESMIATLEDLLASEENGGGLGGLYGGPQMDIPAGPESPADNQPQ